MNRQVCSLCGSKLRIGNLQRSAAPCRSCRRAGVRVVGREITGRPRLTVNPMPQFIRSAIDEARKGR